MKKIKLILRYVSIIIFTRPTTWEYEFRKLRNKKLFFILAKNITNDNLAK